MFWKHVEKTDSCWLWRGSVSPKGQGRFYFCGRVQIASRVAWQLEYGHIQNGLYVLHKCPGGDNPSCVRIDHLYLGTILDNSHDMIARGNVCVGERHWAKRIPELIQRGEERTQHLLTDEAVRIIRSEYAVGTPSAELARRFNVAPRTVRDVLNRQTWTHVV